MRDGRQRNANNYDTVYRTVGGLDGKSMIYEHAIQKVTSTKVYVHQQPRSGNVMGFYQAREGGVYVLDRRELEENGRYRAEYGPTQTSFYLKRSDVEEDVETPDSANKQGGASAPELRPVPVDALDGEVVTYFEQVASGLDDRYDGELSNRRLLETSLRQALVDFHMHGKDSPLLQHLDSLAMAQESGSAEPELQSLPVEQMHVDLVKNLNKVAGALDARYERSFPKRRLIEVALRQMFADLRMYQQEAVTVRWLDVVLLA
jgi:hypothetical protein